MSVLPPGWVAARLSDVVDAIVGGGTPSKANPHYFSGTIPFMTVKDMNERRPTRTQDHISDIALADSSSQVIPKDTIIISTRMGLGKVVRPQVDVAINQDLKAIFHSGAIDKSFLEWWFRDKAKDIQNLGTGTTVKGITLPVLKGLEVSLPPLGEQKRIVSKLDSLSIRIERASNHLDYLPSLVKKYKQAILMSAFKGFLTARWQETQKHIESVGQLLDRVPAPLQSRGGRGATSTIKPGRAGISLNNPNIVTPKNWMWVSLSRISKQETGHTPSRSHPEYWGRAMDWHS